MQTKYRFYKTNDKWYIDLPLYLEEGGNIDDLQMVSGADDFLDLLSNLTDEIFLIIDTEYFNDACILEKLSERYQLYESGCSYCISHPTHGYLEMWLCDVTKHLFGYFPEKIYFTIN